MTSKRLDCLVTGKDQNNKDNAVIIELKQWEKCDNAEGENEVITWVGAGEREVLHPSAQVGQYKLYLQDGHTAFYEENPISLSACSYLHNYHFFDNDVLLNTKFENIINSFPLYSADDVDPLRDFLQERLVEGDGLKVLNRIEGGDYRPSKKLMEHVGNVIKGKPEYVLLDEQLVAYDKVLAWAKKGFHDKQKRVIIIRGGPGTGKSVVAINLMADLLLKNYNAHYATGSKAFTQTLRKVIGNRGAVQFKYFNSYMNAEKNAVDVLICDEAHRIRKVSHNRFTRREDRTDLPQIQELIEAAKVSVFFIDEDQVVRPGEIGSVDYIREYAVNNNCSIYDSELETQFRCAGSDAFVNWVNNTLGIKRTANPIWTGDDNFDFKIFDSLDDLDEAIREKDKQGYNARLTAGFCWPWSKEINPDGTLHEDVDISGFRRPWNARPEATRLAKGIPKAPLWATDPNGIEQVGCIYTAQGFEFDYAGVIFGNDLTYNLDNQNWEGHPEHSYDTVVRRSKKSFLAHVKNTYRVLLSRGLKGCYIYFLDKDTERFFKSRLELV
jgi:hypothetical protein